MLKSNLRDNILYATGIKDGSRKCFAKTEPFGHHYDLYGNDEIKCYTWTKEKIISEAKIDGIRRKL